jgi:hypothetical protein
MTKRYDVLSPRKRKDQEKTYWHKVGCAFEGDKGISIVFDSLPLPDENGAVRVSLFEPREKSDGRKMPNATQDERGVSSKRSRQTEMNDDIPD